MNDTYGYNKAHKSLAQSLRSNQTLGEMILWTRLLSRKQMKGYIFNRQYCIGDYIVDFICRKLKLIIEIDGYSHDFKIDNDKQRDDVLDSHGYRVLRVLEKDVRSNIEGVYFEIRNVMNERERMFNPPAPFSKGND